MRHLLCLMCVIACVHDSLGVHLHCPNNVLSSFGSGLSTIKDREAWKAIMSHRFLSGLSTNDVIRVVQALSLHSDLLRTSPIIKDIFSDLSKRNPWFSLIVNYLETQNVNLSEVLKLVSSRTGTISVDDVTNAAAQQFHDLTHSPLIDHTYSTILSRITGADSTYLMMIGRGPQTDFQNAKYSIVSNGHSNKLTADETVHVLNFFNANWKPLLTIYDQLGKDDICFPIFVHSLITMDFDSYKATQLHQGTNTASLATFLQNSGSVLPLINNSALLRTVRSGLVDFLKKLADVMKAAVEYKSL